MKIKLPRFITYFITLIMILCLFIGFTLWQFMQAVPANNVLLQQNEAKQTAIILTGSQDRLQAGMKLLRTGEVDSLFISGVYPKLRLSELFHALQESPKACGSEENKDCIELGRKATNTKQNACESMEWIKNNNVKYFYLVTSDYHYPRSYAEFSSILQVNNYDAVISPYITRSEFVPFSNWGSEYIKWLIVKTRIFLEKFLPKSSIMSCFDA